MAAQAQRVARGPLRPELAGYEIDALLRAGPRSVAYRGHALADDRRVVVKFQREVYPSERALAAETRAFEIVREVDPQCLVRHLALLPHGHGLALVTEDFGGESLDLRLQDQGALGVEEVLSIGGALAGALGRLHAAGIVHRDIAAGNVAWNAGEGTLRLLDLKECSLLEREEAEGDTEDLSPAMLVYAAPERTGRMNRAVDARGDLYAAGVLLFELLAGRPPFIHADARELRHAHLARPPPRLDTTVPGLPPMLAEIVARLLAKNPDDRYGSAIGLAHDLERCLDGWRAGDAGRFTLGEADARSRFVLPDRLYGREEETRALFEALDAARAGRPQLLLVAGFSGVGKSVLVNEVRRPIAEGRGWYCAGKFDQYLRDIPYLAWTSVLASLVKQLLAEPEERLAGLRAALGRALAGYGALIGDLVPEIEQLLGPQPPLPEATPAEAQARFARAVTSFVETLAGADHPLVIFVDDLQWADLPSLQLLESLAGSGRAAHLLILGAYRDNEVGPGHPLAATIARLTEAGHAPAQVALRPLGEGDVQHLVADTVQRDDAECADLGGLVHRKTGGNPFFVRQFLADLARKGHLAFDHAAAAWRWDRRAIEAEQYTDNVVDFMSGRIGALPPEARAVLEYAACLGVGFDLRTLVGLSGETFSAVARSLDRAMAEGLVVALGADYRLAVTQSALAERRGAEPAINPRYRFLHDRVQASVHDGIEAAARAALHLRIARSMLSADGRDSPDENAIAVMDHLQECAGLIEAPAERLRFARVCLTASRRALASTAVEPAVRYAALARRLLPDDAGETAPDLAIAIDLQAAETGYVAERFEDARSAAGAVLSRAGRREDRVAAHNVLIGIGVAEQRFVDATDYAIGVLARELDVRLPRRPSMARVLAELARTRQTLGRLDTETLLDLPPMRDPLRLDAMAMLMKAATNAYWGNPTLVPLIAATTVRLSRRHGNTGLSAYGYALTGMVLTHAFASVELGYRLGRLSMDLLARTGDRHLVGKTGLLWHGFIRHSTDPLRVCAADVLDCYDAAMDAGDVENAVYCGTVAYYADLLSGRPLDWIETRYQGYLEALFGSAQRQTILALKVWVQVVANLRDDSRVEPKARGAHIDWPRELETMLAQPAAQMTIATICGGPGFLAFLLDDMEEAERQFALLYDRQKAAMGQAFLKPSLALYALVLADKLGRGRATAGDRLRLLRLGRMLAGWARHNPHDYAPFQDLLAAELAFGRGHTARALARWGDAMERARDSGILYLEAWAAERSARAHAEAGHTGLARHLWDRARAGWQRSGILARLRLLDRQETGAAAPAAVRGAPLVTEAGDQDIESVLDAVRAVSEVVEVDELVDRVLRILLVSAGARRGTLMIQEESLRVLSSATVGPDGGVEKRAEQGEARPDRLPLGLVDYVVRTRAALAVEDARTHEWLARDPYVAATQARSLLGVPLMRHGRLVGLVVLENDLGAGVFSEAVAGVASIIAGQAAVSLENARLFAAQKRRSDAFARFVPRPFLEHMGHAEIEDVRLGEAVQEDITVMFADLRRSTSLSETMGVSDYFGLINAFLAQVTPAIGEAGGFVDGFTGDGCRAIFIGPADAAVDAAIAMQRRLRHYNRVRREKGWVELEMGIGLHTGPALLGTIGVADRMATTVIGDTVNTASRLEGLTKFYRAPVLISRATRERLRDAAAFSIREVGRDQVRGHQAALSVHEVIDARPRRERAELGATVFDFGRALEGYFARAFAEAEAGFAHCLERAPSDITARHYRDLARQHARDGVPEGWDGVNRREEK